MTRGRGEPRRDSRGRGLSARQPGCTPPPRDCDAARSRVSARARATHHTRALSASPRELVLLVRSAQPAAEVRVERMYRKRPAALVPLIFPHLDCATVNDQNSEIIELDSVLKGRNDWGTKEIFFFFIILLRF